ncbi:MAG: TonB-dependent receptor [Cyclobacteriaceae bacterium]
MIRSLAYSFIILLLSNGLAHAQHALSGMVVDASSNQPITAAEVFLQESGKVVKVDRSGAFEFQDLAEGEYELIVFNFEYQTLTTNIKVPTSGQVKLSMKPLLTELSEVVIRQQRDELFNLKRLQPVEGTAIYAGKKNEVIMIDQLVGSMATNNARQIYAQVVGLNIYENADAGLQLNIGGRGLDPNRTANFNTRQNGYDISADVLGYPESYYTPPAEALSEIQVVRGAASLQYGTQFGGLVNFKMKQPATDKALELTSRQSAGSFGLFSSFNSLSGTKDKFSYYTYYQYKQGDGFRPNSGFNSHNFFGHFKYEFTERTSIAAETTYMKYLAQQPGGLTDPQFDEDPNFSNRKRNWFDVDWKLFNLKFEHKFSSMTELSINLFGLNAERHALGFRGNPTNLNSNPITEEDEQLPDGSYVYPRDLISGEFRNWGLEPRLLHRYKIADQDAVLLVGAKYYRANNSSIQGPGSEGTDADFSFRFDEFSDYPSQSDFIFPNRNFALFGEHIFFIDDKLTITPGARFEYIKTESAGTYQQVNFDNAGNPIFNQALEDNRTLEREFLLLGIGGSYDLGGDTELYANISENYRSVTYSDIRVVNPTFIIDENITDESGFTADIGIRGKWKGMFSYDISTFALVYDNRIGIILDDRANRVRKNIGKAFIRGIETFVDWNILKSFKVDNRQLRLNWFVNGAFTTSEYIESQENNVKGKKVEFIPAVNLKTGVQFGYRNLMTSLQYTRISEQFTDVENSSTPDSRDSRNGLIGEIPSYQIMDLSFSYSFKRLQLETGINNLLDASYFTRRATGYPGPGIIPSEPRNFYLTLQVKI